MCSATIQSVRADVLLLWDVGHGHQSAPYEHWSDDE